MPSENPGWKLQAIAAIANTVAAINGPPGSGPSDAQRESIVNFLIEQQARMPDYLRFPMGMATLLFDASSWALFRARFHAQSLPAREKQFAAWKHAPLGFARDLIRYYESLGTLALYSSPSTATRPAATLQHENIHSSPPEHLHCDIAVIGSGPGGAITACLLAEAGRNVLLIEEGANYSLESCEPFSREEMVQKYRNGGQTVAMGSTKIAYVEGCCLGGGSEINSGLYHRTPPEILDQWRKDYLVDGLSDAEMRPHFEACERDVSVSCLQGPAPAGSLKLHQGAQRLGWKSLEVPRWFSYQASQGGQPAQGTRQSMTKTYLPRFLAAGGKLLPATRVAKLRRDNGIWSLRCQRKSGPITVSASKVFVCAGAVQTPLLLRRSGIAFNIGNSLALHPTIKVVARFPDQVNTADMGVPVHQVKEFAPKFSFGCSISTPAYLSLGLLDYPGAVSHLHQSWPHLATYYAMVTGDPKGSVRRLPGHRDALVNYPLSPENRQDLTSALAKLCELLFAAGASELYPSLPLGQPLRHSADLPLLPQIIPAGNASLMTIHLFSSCPMGENRSQCAVDSYGRLYHQDDLFINDASILCTAPTVNPQGTIMALARRNTLHFLATG